MAGHLQGKIVAVGPSGSLITDLTAEMLQRVPRNGAVRIQCDEHVTYGIHAPGHKQPPRTLVAVIGPSGSLELEIVGESAHEILGISVGQSVDVSW